MPVHTVKVHTNEKEITHKIDISTNLFLINNTAYINKEIIETYVTKSINSPYSPL